MPTYKTKALVLQKTKLGETDLIITLLDEDGLQRRAVAKGARKPGAFLAARLELYMQTECVLCKGRNLDIITDAQTLEANSGCRSDIEHSAAAATAAELVAKATAELNSEPLLYQMLQAAFTQIGSSSGLAAMMIAVAALLKLCAALGVRPNAQELLGVDEQTAAWTQTLLQARFADLAAYNGEEYRPILTNLINFCQRWLAQHLDIRLKSLEFLAKLL